MKAGLASQMVEVQSKAEADNLPNLRTLARGGQCLVIVSVGFSAISNPEVFESDDPTAVQGALGPSMIVVLIAWLVGVGFWLWLGIADSQPGRNKYGRNPKHPYDDDAAVFS